MNQLKKLQEFGQSVWLDYIRRSLITSGELERLIREDGLRGVTSNPAIFEKALTGSTDYEGVLETLRENHTGAVESYERIAIRDIQDAADVLSDVYRQTNRRDGYVSLEVSPYLARDTEGTIEEARRLWETLDRENVMIKVPATPQGIPAIEVLISEGINVNVTLIFALSSYEQVAEAYLSGLERLIAKGGDPAKVSSVASFFISRIDAAVDAALQERRRAATSRRQREDVDRILGRAAIANAKLAYFQYHEKLSNPRWQRLSEAGAQSQRLLWASTSTKNPNYRDTLYVEELIGHDTVNTIPPATFEAFRDHGRVRATLDQEVGEALCTMESLDRLGVPFDEITDELLDKGLLQFAEAFDKLLKSVDTRCGARSAVPARQQSQGLPADLKKTLQSTLDDWKANGKVRRVWSRDASLWTRGDEAKWLGWLGLSEDQSERIEELFGLARETKEAGFTHVILLGMGGSSLCPDVLRHAFGRVNGYPELSVLDSTDPQQLAGAADRVDLATTLFIVSSKSGTTLEPNIFKQYFFERVHEVLGNGKAGSHFIAITDPGSDLHGVAEADGFRHICFGLPSVGGRYSALSNFGMAPAALMGLDVEKLLDRADEMALACSPCVPVEDNPGLVLGTVLGLCGETGRDKVTIVASPQINDFGAWLEQLLAESTGKMNKGLIPVHGERTGSPEVYGEDRLFVYLRLDAAPDPAQDRAISKIATAGFPVVILALNDLYDLGREFFRWEMATAVAGSLMGINPFDQPDVEASKVATRALTDEYERTGALPGELPFLEESGLKLFARDEEVEELKRLAGGNASLAACLCAHFQRLSPGDYLGILAYIEMNRANEERLQEVRHAVRDRYRVATCLGFGPRFLHSTGQAYKGGPNTGVFLQITSDDANDIGIPGQKYTFGVVKAAQARGDFQVLNERKRRAIRIHLPADLGAGIRTFKQAVEEALGI